MTHSPVVILSGGATGIGHTITERLVQDGYRVVVFDIASPVSPEAGVEYRPVDISVRSQVRDAVDEVVSKNGAPYGLVHNAAFQFISPYLEVTPERWQKSFDVNVTGAFNLTQSVIPHMISQGAGRIIMTTSSSLYSPVQGMAHYIATKGALTGLVRGLAVELGAHNITVNALAPGLTDTKRKSGGVPPEHFARVAQNQAIHRTGLPRDHAGVVSFLLSEDSGFMTGQTLLNDGGEGHV